MSDEKRLSGGTLHVIFSQENTWQPFPYPEGLPVRRLSFVQWFHSSAPQSRYPKPECYHCKQKGKNRSVKGRHSVVNMLHMLLSGCQQRGWLTPISAQTKADVSCWADDLPQRTNFPSVGLIIVVYRGNDYSCLISAERKSKGISLRVQGKTEKHFSSLSSLSLGEDRPQRLLDQNRFEGFKNSLVAILLYSIWAK